MSDVKIHVPSDVKVTSDGSKELENEAMDEQEDDELLPEIHFVLKNKMPRVEFVYE